MPTLLLSAISTTMPATMLPSPLIPYSKKQLHCNRLPEELKKWKHMLKYPRSQKFILAASKEFEHLQARGTFQLAFRHTNKQILPLV